MLHYGYVSYESEIPRSAIMVCYDSGAEKVLGGLAADWYGRIEALHLTYLIVDPQARKQGLLVFIIQYRSIKTDDH